MAQRGRAAHQEDTPSPADSPVIWQTSFSLLTNRFFVYDLLKLLSITFVSVNIIFFPIFAVNNSLQDFPGILRLFSVLLLFILILIVLVCLLWFRNRFSARFTVSQEGAVAEVYRTRDRAVNRAVAAIGAIAGKPGVAGAGLLAMSGEKTGIAWKEVQRVKEYPAQKVITLMNNWRVVVRLYCTDDNYEEVVDAVRAYTKERRNTEAAK